MNMKYISRLLFTVGLVLGLSACTEDAYETIATELPAKGEMSVNLTFALPDGDAQTRSKVSGTETRVHTMQMVCFDANGGYLGIRNAEISPYDENNPDRKPDAGTIKGTVPQNTSRIHFIANRNLSIPLKASVGTPEEEVMASEELSTLWNENTFGTGDEAHQEVCYWGYHKEAKAADMDDWLNPTEEYTQDHGKSKVYMIRDRAQVVLKYDPDGSTVPVTKIEWLIHHGLERGYLAPAKEYWGNDSYYEASTVAGAGYVSKAEMNPYPVDKRYSLWVSATENDENNFDTTYELPTGATPNTSYNKYVPQFLFDDSNEDLNGLKAILRVTYLVDGEPRTVYHVLKLNDDEENLYDVVRNETYYIEAKLLNPDVAFYETLEEAITGDQFVNAQPEVARTIPILNNDTYSLQILLESGTTSIVLNREATFTMNFAFRTVADITQPGSTNTNDFDVKWEKSQTFCTDPQVSYDADTKQFIISTTVKPDQLTDHLQDEYIVVEHKDSKLKRYIHVYVIDQFRYKIYPTITKVNNDYLLNFQLPPMEHTQFLPDGSGDPNELIYPEELYPIEVKFTTNTLNAYGISEGVTNYGLFGVSNESTSNLLIVGNFEDNYNSPISTTVDNEENKKHWYFQQANNYWDFWYTYSLKTYPTDGMVNIYFKDVRDHIKYANVQDVGLFLYVEYFGKNYSVHP